MRPQISMSLLHFEDSTLGLSLDCRRPGWGEGMTAIFMWKRLALPEAELSLSAKLCVSRPSAKYQISSVGTAGLAWVSSCGSQGSSLWAKLGQLRDGWQRRALAAELAAV
ncbi:hypothetical protein DdX_10904 [Ditylenchus destructor]|uniref:Uncharacterized protein n=1 Tax=Ditylenchus destructor TaxID=166010 RepID=A0AAD4N1B4_9BILA|nr:hypothetical protein DdX_10904 [Ditylenchus destructor]